MPITTAPAPPAPPAPPVPTPQPSPNVEEGPREAKTSDPVAAAAAEIAQAAQAMNLPPAELARWLFAAVRHGLAD